VYGCSIDPTKVGVLGMSSGGNLAGVSGVTGAEGQARADAVVTWSGALHLEDDNQPARANYIGCAYVDCQNAWENASPYHLCCNVGNLSASTPFLLFNSQDELIPIREPNEMYDLVSPTTIKITKVLLRGTAHAAEYRLTTILCASGDRCASNEGWTPTGNVTQASVVWLQAHLCGLPVC
jgi:acetyl esterase/lipase